MPLIAASCRGALVYLMKRRPATQPQRYELWQDATGYVLLTDNHTQRDTLLQPPSTLLTTITATSWEEACHLRDTYLYGPQDPRDR
jgi:hypothetical protein